MGEGSIGSPYIGEKDVRLMSGRAEMSPPLQDQGPELTASGGMKVALIGPNEAHRKIVAKALCGSEARAVREFTDYPADMAADLPRMLEQHYDVVMIDVDSDQSYALKLVETIAGMTSAIVMVYSKRNDPDLLMSCMRAGARDFLPLPAEGEDDPAPGPQLVQTEQQEAVAAEQLSYEPPVRPVEPTPFAPAVEYNARNGSAPVAPFVEPYQPQSLQQDIDAWDQAHLRVPEPDVVKRDPAPPPQPVVPIQQPIARDPRPIQQPVVPFQPPAREVESQSKAAEPSESGNAPTTFDEWDSAFLRTPQSSGNKIAGISPRAAVTVVPRAPQPASPTNTDQDPRALATAELLARVESEQGSVPADTSALSATRPKIERPPIEPLIQFHYEVPEEERVPDRRWMVWTGIAVAVAVAAGLAVVFLHPFGHSAPPVAPQQQVVVQQPAVETPVASVPEVSPAAAKPSAAIPAASSATSQTPNAPVPVNQVQVSSDQMDAQLSAPSRIAKTVKAAPTSAEEAPPTGFSAGGMDNGGGVPGGAIFGGQNKVQVVAGVHAISSGVADGMLLRKVEPIYPKFAKDSRITGTVVLKATITKAGSIEGLQVLSGPKILSEAALNAVKYWRYRPYMLNNDPVEVQTTINVVFNLTN